MPLLDGSEVGIRKGVPVAQINVPYPACCMCGESITDNLFTTTIKEGTMDKCKAVGFVCDHCRGDD
jgi:hypothetical protein